jgi:hypothetical protein
MDNIKPAMTVLMANGQHQKKHASTIIPEEPKNLPYPNPARMYIALPIQTTLCCPKHYGAVSGGEAAHFKKRF